MTQNQLEVDATGSYVAAGSRAKGRRIVRFVSTIKAAFTVPEMPVEQHDVTRDHIDRVVVSARSHGNMRLQHGLYYTQRDLDAQYDRVKQLDFSE